jgi:hypothetical protein
VHRFVSVLAMALLGFVAALASGCADGANGGIATGGIGQSTAGPASGPAGGEPLARSTRVASTSARARICGLSFDAAKLKASYLAYEAKQGVDTAQLSVIEKNFDTTSSTVAAQRAAIAERCSPRQLAGTRDKNAELSIKYKDELKADLARYVAGSFAPDEKPRPADGPLDSKAFWKEQDDG